MSQQIESLLSGCKIYRLGSRDDGRHYDYVTLYARAYSQWTPLAR